MMESVSVNGLFVPPLPKDKPANPPEPPPPGAEDFDSQDDSAVGSFPLFNVKGIFPLLNFSI